MKNRDKESNCVKVLRVQLITGFNTDRGDLVAGGSGILGPYMWVAGSHADAFIAEMKKRYGSDNRVREIDVTGETFVKADEVLSLEEEIKAFEEYLANLKPW